MTNATTAEVEAAEAKAKTEAEAAAKLGTEGKTLGTEGKSKAVAAQATADTPLEVGAAEQFAKNVASQAAVEAARVAQLIAGNP